MPYLTNVLQNLGRHFHKQQHKQVLAVKSENSVIGDVQVDRPVSAAAGGRPVTAKAIRIYPETEPEKNIGTIKAEKPTEIGGSFFFKLKSQKVGPKAPTAVQKTERTNRDLSSSFTEHTLHFDGLAEMFPKSNINQTDPAHSAGLNSEEARRLLQVNGSNILPPPKEKSNLVLFLSQFCNVLWLLLLFATALSFAGYFTNHQHSDLIIAMMLLVMIFVMCCASFLQERKTRAVLKGFSNLLPTTCSAIRDGHEIEIGAENLVPGDIVIIKNGSKVPADARILHSSGLKLETSSITGESEPIEFTADPVDRSVGVFSSQNLAFNGSFCVDGYGIGIVVRTGPNTIIGQIAAMTTNQHSRKSSLEIQILHFVKFLAVLSLTMAVCTFLVGAIIDKWKNPMHYAVYGFLIIIIANVPTGLPATVTSQLTIITHRLATKQVYLKRLDVVEALGATTVICSDKTGTLTMNKMAVTDIWYCNETIQGSIDPKPEVNRTDPLEKQYDPPLCDLLTVMSVCNKAQFERDGEVGENFTTFADVEAGNIDPIRARKPKNAIGSPSEVAMVQYCEPLFSVAAVRNRYKPVFEIPFNSKRKWHLMVVENRDDTNENLPSNNFRLFMKGAPEILIRLCSSIATANGIQPLDDEMKTAFQTAYEHFGSNGRRVIGFVTIDFKATSAKDFTDDGNCLPMSGLTFLGMCAIMDPPRVETASAIAKCKHAGIKVFMVTGDHPCTAAAIAREIGLIGPVDQPENERDWDVCHGEAIPMLTDDQWTVLLGKKYLVFGRTTPEQKLLIVEQCQKRNDVITMTGDGVNDAPALKRADIGVAMGLTGSDVAKQAADIILMDDNFASIVNGIEQGRLLFDNLRKTIAYTLSHLCPEAYPLLLNFAVGLPMGLSTLQIMTIDLGTELAPAISLAYENIEEDIMSRPPRPRSQRLVSKGLLSYSYLFAGHVMSLVGCVGYLYTFWHHGIALRDLPYSANYYFQDNSPIFNSNGRQYSSQEQEAILAEACTAWYIGIVVTQMFHIWSVRTRSSSIFTHGLRNYRIIIAVLIEAGLLCLFVYTPGVQYILSSRPPPEITWIFPVIGSLFMLVVNEFRKLYIRRHPKGSRLTSLIKW